jgi:plasmid stabilization system protein ParE
MKIIWTSRALKTYFKVVDYLKEEWGDNLIKDFACKVENVIAQIKDNPEMFEASNRYKYVRKGLITKHNTLFYRIKPRKKEIELLIFWDNRQDDKGRPY